jgi:hypothetical protein
VVKSLIKSADTDLSREIKCNFCGRKLGDLGYYYITCHACGDSYCYVHMERHTTAHPFKKNL